MSAATDERDSAVQSKLVAESRLTEMTIRGESGRGRGSTATATGPLAPEPPSPPLPKYEPTHYLQSRPVSRRWRICARPWRRRGALRETCARSCRPRGRRWRRPAAGCSSWTGSCSSAGGRARRYRYSAVRQRPSRCLASPRLASPHPGGRQAPHCGVARAGIPSGCQALAVGLVVSPAYAVSCSVPCRPSH